VLLHWQLRSPLPIPARYYRGRGLDPPRVPTPATRVPPHRPGGGFALVMPPTGEWSGQAERMRFARLIHRPGRVLGVPSARAACGGHLSLSWLPPRVVLADPLPLPVLIFRWPGWVLPSSCHPIWCKALRDRP
jgi:hypothetical protein